MKEKQPRPESLRKLRQELREDFEFMAMTLTNQAVDTNARFTELGQDITELARRMEAGLRQAGADASERSNQVVGRLGLMEQRFSTFLGAGDRERAELRALWQQLERRMTEVEKRLPPPGSPAA